MLRGSSTSSSDPTAAEKATSWRRWVLSSAASGRVDDEALLRRGVRPGVPALNKSSFAGVERRKSIRLEAASAASSYAVELQNPVKDPNPAWTYKNELWKRGQERIIGRSPASWEYKRLDPQRGLAALEAVKMEQDDPASEFLEELSSFRIYSPDTDTLRGLRPDSKAADPVGLAGGRLPESVDFLLRSRGRDKWTSEVCSDALELIDWARSFRSRRVGKDIPLSPSVASSQHVIYFKDRFMKDRRNGLTGYDASEGALYVLFAAVLAASSSAPAILAIDNIAHGLNPRLARALMSLLCKWLLEGSHKRQVLLTTHSPLVLDGLPLENDDVRLFAVGRSRRGHTTVSPVRINVGDLKKEGEIWTVSRLWVVYPMFRVAIACEGPADRAIIEAILDSYLEDYETSPIQPPVCAMGGDAGPFGCGWKGVRTWCRQELAAGGGIGTVLANSDILVIQVEADVAAEQEIRRSKPCPPPGGNADEIRTLILEWMGIDEVPGSIVLCVPSKCLETWVLVGLFPSDPSTKPCEPPPADGICVECRDDVKELLRSLGKKLRPKLVVRQNGRMKNQVRGYKEQRKKIVDSWRRIVSVCSQAPDLTMTCKPCFQPDLTVVTAGDAR